MPRSWMDVVDAPWPRRAFQTGMLVFLAFSPYYLLIWLLLLIGGPELRDSSGTLVRVDLLAFTYPLGVFAAGTIIGLGFRAARSLWVAIPTGIFALAPWAAAVAVAFDHGYSSWKTEHTVVTAVTAVCLGAAFGVGFWKARQSDPDVKRAHHKVHRHAAT